MSNALLPGSDVVGFGFNALGNYDTSAMTYQIFKHVNEDAQSVNYGSNTYSIPDNLAYDPTDEQNTSVQVFQTQEQVQTYFAGKAGLSASVTSTYGKFSGEIQAAYSQSSASSEAMYYGLCRAEWQGYQLLLSDDGSSWLSDTFTNDPTYQSLPTTYNRTDPQNQALFFQFFRKWGTHFVKSVTCGGSLNYCVTVNQEFSSDDQSISASITAEYKGVFASGKAEAQANWAQAGQSWASNRNVQIQAVGGLPSALGNVEAVDPGYGQNFNSVYDTWVNTLLQNPAVMDFQLTPMSDLFSGGQQSAVDAALIDYMNSVVYTTATLDYDGSQFSTAASILVNGVAIQPSSPNTPPAPNQCPIAVLQAALFDASWNLLFTQVYYQQTVNGWNGSGVNPEAGVWEQVYNDVSSVQGVVNVAFVVCGVDSAQNFPSADLVKWLNGFGASLTAWRYVPAAYNGGQFFVNYLMVGDNGGGPATEKFAGPLNISNTYGGEQYGDTLDTYMVVGIGAAAAAATPHTAVARG